MLLTLHRNLTKQRGIGLLELMLSIAIIAILLIMATRYYQNATQGKNISNTISMVGGYIAAEVQYATLHTNGYTSDITQLNLPIGFTSTPHDPWGGNVSLTGTTSTMLVINMTGVPAAVCNNILLVMIQNNTGATVTCSNGMTVTYQ
jgi:Tfp pilus assembly protein PilE